VRDWYSSSARSWDCCGYGCRDASFWRPFDLDVIGHEGFRIDTDNRTIRIGSCMGVTIPIDILVGREMLLTWDMKKGK
jgi:hypothetical protein